MRVRLEWGQGTAAIWRGHLAIDRGAITAIEPLGVDADTTGSMWIENGQVLIQPRRARTYDGVDLDISAPLDAKLLVTLHSHDQAAVAAPVEIDLKTLIDEPYATTLDEQGNELQVRRAPGDRLRVQMAHSSLIFTPGEPVTFELTPHLLGTNVTGDVQIKTEILTARTGESWQEATQTIATPNNEQPAAGVPIQFVAPRREGVFDLVMTASQPKPRRGLAQVNPLASSENMLAQRRVQFVVLEDQVDNVEDNAAPPTAIVDEIKPGGQWWERVAKLPQLPGIKNGPLTNGETGIWNHPLVGELTALGPSDNDKKRGWVAYPLDVKKPGQVHVLEIEYPAAHPQRLGISIVEQSGGMGTTPTSIDSGLHVSKHVVAEASRIETHRVVFWPQTESPVVILTNQGKKERAAFGRIRVLGPKQSRTALLRLGGTTRTRLPKAEGLPSMGQGRLLAAYLAEPLLPENFSAPQVQDPLTGQPLDDWLTFYTGGARAIEYLQHVGYNALVIPAFSGGGTIYPTEVLESTPKYDNGRLLATGQDPIRKDVLEMLFRMCDREGVQLIPAIDFSSPLPTLETELRRRGPEQGIRLVGRNGRAWIDEFQTPDGRAAYYNPLNHQVQAAMRTVVREIVERYHDHPSFGGVMLATGSSGFALLPGEPWALDDETFDRFAQDTGVPVPRQNGPKRFAARAEFVRGQHRETWLVWRARQIRELLTGIRSDIRATGSGAKLFVAAEGIYTNSEIEQSIRPALPSRGVDQDLPLTVGLDLPAIGSDRDIVILRPHSIAPAASATDDAVQRRLNHSDAFEATFTAAGSTGSLFLHQSHPLRVDFTAQGSPFGHDVPEISIASQIATAGVENRRRFVHGLAVRDDQIIFDGGSQLAFGQERAIQDVLAAYRRLPPVAFEKIALDNQSIVVRTATYQGATYAYVVNDSAWPATAVLNITGSQAAVVEDLKNWGVTSQLNDGQLAVQLEPYDLAAYRIGAVNQAITVTSAAVGGDASSELASRIEELVARATSLGIPQPTKVLENPNFEVPDQVDAIPSWNFSGGVGSSAVVDSQFAHDGRQSVRLASSGQLALLVSDSFPLPETGRLAFSAWLRVESGQAVPDLRLAVGGKQKDGSDYYRFGRISGLKRFTGGEWEHVQFQVDDLPLDGGEGQLQIRFDLMGTGTVWVDHVQVSSLHFSDAERTQMTKLIGKAHLYLGKGRLSDCDKLLRGYWPRFLEQHVEVPKERVAKAPRTAQAPPPPPKAEESWWKRSLPGFLR